MPLPARISSAAGVVGEFARRASFAAWKEATGEDAPPLFYSDEFPDGVWWVPLASVRDGALVLATFDGPARAIRCALAITDAVRDFLGLTLDQLRH